MKLIVIVAGACALLACTPAQSPPNIQRQTDSSFLVDYEVWLHTGELPTRPSANPLEAMVP